MRIPEDQFDNWPDSLVQMNSEVVQSDRCLNGMVDACRRELLQMKEGAPVDQDLLRRHIKGKLSTDEEIFIQEKFQACRNWIVAKVHMMAKMSRDGEFFSHEERCE